MTNQPVWPAILKQDEVHDVLYIESHDAWLNDQNLCRFPFDKHDMLIDSQGWVFSLVYDKRNKSVSFDRWPYPVSLEDFTLILRKHLCTLNTCCISKLSVASYADGFDMIRQSLDQH